MSLRPTFEIGVWNAWLFMLAFVILHMGAIVVSAILGDDAMTVIKRSVSSAPNLNVNKYYVYARVLVFLLILAYSIFLPLKLGTGWLYVGIAVFLTGLTIYEVACALWARATPDVPITKGPYTFSRHPIYLSMFIMLFGAAIAAASWLGLIPIIVLFLLSRSIAIEEEQFCTKVYGDSYFEYMKRTPRWVGLPR